MSKQAQYAMIGQVINPAQSATSHLRRDVLPVLSSNGEALPDLTNVAWLDGYGLVKHVPMSDAQYLGAILLWVISRGDIPVPAEVMHQAAELASRVLDYPKIIAEAKRSSQSNARKGKGKHYDPLVPNTRSAAIAAAIKRKGSEDRDIVVVDLASTLGIGAPQARRILAQHGWPGRDKPAS
jgi:hypothetical protein